MRDRSNIEQLVAVGPDLMGLIFYPKSKRFVSDLPEETINLLKQSSLQVVGVFVNEQVPQIVEVVRTYGLDYVQLHGDEHISVGQRLVDQGVRLIKVFRIADELPKVEMQRWSPLVDYFLFDTRTDQYGGSGKRFDWSVLKQYALDVPFLLSGGIGREEIAEVLSMDIPQLAGIDVNSRVEVSPGLKDIEMIRELKEVIC